MATIVLADDDADLLATYAPCLQNDGHTVWMACDGLEALELVRQHRPDLLLLDLWMPRLNGYQVLDRLRHDSAAAHVRVMILSNLSDGGSRLEAFGCGASEYLVKGLALSDLLARIHEMLSGLEVISDPS